MSWLSLPWLRGRALVVLTVFAFALAGILGLRSSLLARQRQALTESLDAATKKAALMQKRYQEAKAEADRLLAEAAAAPPAPVRAAPRPSDAAVEKLRAEKAVLANANKELMDQIAKLRAEKDESERVRDQTSEEVARLKAQMKEASGQQESAKGEAEKLDKRVSHLTKAVDVSADLNRSLKAQVEGLGKEKARCEADNAQLAALAQELIEKYRDKGFMSVLLQKEPITQVKRVEVEKLLEEYRAKVEGLKVVKGK